MINIINQLDNAYWVDKLLNRSQLNDDTVNQTVETIVRAVKTNKDQALKEYTKKFDNVTINEFRVSEDTINQAFELVSETLINDLKRALDNIKRFHEAQVLKTFTIKDTFGSELSSRVRPIETVGIYVPGGLAAYPSTVLMNAVPAKIAGVKKIIMVTPPLKDGTIKPSILIAAKLAGVDEIYKVGGAQSIAALAYGTESVPKVDKIVGPGNIYVAMAKRYVSGVVGIDMIAGPSEILVIADEDANPDYIAADLMSQAEHDPLASAICLTPSQSLAERVQASIIKLIDSLPKKDIIASALKNYGGIIVTSSMEEAVNFANKIAPEHLELLTKNPFELVEKIENAGAIFIGEYSPEPIGDYFAGHNHTLPTSATSRFSSALSTQDFYKKTSIIHYNQASFNDAKGSVARLAHEEGLDAHKLAITIRK
jgi:histidinol dehydrogenase